MLRLPSAPFGPAWMALAAVSLLGGCAEQKTPRPDHEPVVPGLSDAELPAEVRGRVLLGELGCTNCHDAGPARIEHHQGPDLSKVGGRIDANYLQSFVTNPHAMEPQTMMPDLLRNLHGATLTRTADELTHYLRSFSPTPPSHVPIDLAAHQRGQILYESIGCKACHFTNQGSRLFLARKYSVASLQAFLLAPHDARPSQRMPDMSLTPTEAFDLANHILSPTMGTTEPAAAMEASKADTGRTHFARLGCANCHALPDAGRQPSAAAAPLADLDPTRGCLAEPIGDWPRYSLTAEQRADITTALANITQPLDGEARVQQLLASRNCLACHRRGDVDAVTLRQDFFATHEASIGEEGRLPPSLTGIGSKLQRSWLASAIAHGQTERPYLSTRMPGFGESFAEELASLLAETDELPPITIEPLPKDRKEAEKITRLGGELVGDKGMNCITCHLFAGERVGAMGAIDLVHSTGKRLRPEWFSHFLRDPFQFKPNTLMPKFFPDGKSTRPEFADGDIDKQIDAMWHYLAKGRNVRKPRGIHRPAIELVVADETVMLRRSVQNTGKRGISVGYPGGVNITFDAENLGLNQIWWGRFIDARPVWTGQGSGQAHILGKQRATLPNGPAFAELDGPTTPWPTKTRRERGDSFLGYDLDAQQRPSFRYVCDGVTITDTPKELPGATGSQTSLRRTVQFVSATRKALYFRAAIDARIDELPNDTVAVGKSLQLHLPGVPFHVRSVDDKKELLLLITVDDAPVEIVINYSWTGGGK